MAAILGAWAGDAVGGRLAFDPLRIGDFHLLWASIVAWLAIGLVAILAVLVPERQQPSQPRVQTQVRRAAAGTAAAAAPGSESEASST